MDIKKKTCSIRDVAAYLGLAPSTVSRVLNNRMGTLRVAEETRDRILAAAKELNYTPNVHAKRLFSRRSNVLALVLPAFNNRGAHVFQDFHLVEFFSGMEQALMDSEYRPLIIFNDSRFVQKKDYLSLFRERSVDAMMIWGSCADELFWEETLEENYPVLFLTNPPFDRERFHYMVHDYEKAACTVMEHLLLAGHRKIAWVGGHPENGVNKDMELGIAQAVKKFPDVELFPVYGEFNVAKSVAVVSSLLKEKTDISAVLAANVTCAEGIRTAMEEMGIGIPARKALAACDCVEYLEKSNITSIVVDDFELGRQSVYALLDIISGRKKKVKVRIPAKFCRGLTT